MTEKLKPDMMFYAFRYALGRMTYAVSDVSQYLIDHWDEIDANHQRLIHQEIAEALTNDAAGHECDKERWRAVLAMPNTRAQPEAVTNAGDVEVYECGCNACNSSIAIYGKPSEYCEDPSGKELYSVKRKLTTIEADLAKAREVVAKFMMATDYTPNHKGDILSISMNYERMAAALQSARVYMEGK